MLQSNPQALHAFDQSQSSKTIALLTGFTGGFLIGYFGTKLLSSEGSADKSQARYGVGLGLGFAVVTFHLDGRSKRHAQNAARHYNAAE